MLVAVADRVVVLDLPVALAVVVALMVAVVHLARQVKDTVAVALTPALAAGVAVRLLRAAVATPRTCHSVVEAVPVGLRLLPVRR